MIKKANVGDDGSNIILFTISSETNASEELLMKEPGTSLGVDERLPLSGPLTLGYGPRRVLLSSKKDHYDRKS